MTSDSQRTQALPGGSVLGTVIKLHSLRVRCEAGPDKGREWLLEQLHLSVGSGPEADVQLSDPTVSRLHATISFHASGEQAPHGWTVTDLGSRNGTLLDDVPVMVGFLRHGSRIRVGQSVLSFVPREESLLARPSETTEFHGVIGSCPAMKRIFGILQKVSPMNVTVVLTGPTGAGKGALARAIHEASPRRAKPMAVLDCGNLDPELMRAELFGHMKGAFTGAAEARPGVFEVASGGTLFVDEIGELPLDLQPKLLRVLDERRVTRIGSHQAVAVDVRVIAATHRDLRRMVAEGAFREDLLYRLAVVEVGVPPLRERPEDLELLARHVLESLGQPARWPLAAEVMDRLRQHSWPGNVREFRNVLERALALAGDEPIGPEHVAMRPGSVEPTGEPTGEPAAKEGGTLAGTERELIVRVLEKHGQNRTHAAAELRIAVTTLRRKMRKYGLE